MTHRQIQIQLRPIQLRNHWLRGSFLALTLIFGCVAAGPAQELTKENTAEQKRIQSQSSSDSAFPTSMKLAAKAVRASTVTIRVDKVPTLKFVQVLNQTSGQKSKSGYRSQKPAENVAVFSGVLVKQGYVAAPLFLPNAKNPEVRITLPDGEQTIGRPRILDEYSGLAIISIKDHTIPCLKCCDSSEPIVGDWVVSGAAWGRQEALISLGMISGIGYRLPSSSIEPPPMIVCDLRAAQTSKGSGVVSANGKLIGIVMAISSDRRWTYVVPSSHIHRLFRNLALHESRTDSKKDEILVLKRQVPRLGVHVDNVNWHDESRSYDVIIRSVSENGPAELAGLKRGDQIKSVNGKVVRAWYDVVRDFYNRQPGDKIKLCVIRNKKKIDVTVILGGAYAASGANLLRLSDYIKPEIDLKNQQNQLTQNSPSSSPFNQLVNYSIQNLMPTPCVDSDAIDRMLDSLEDERNKNQALQKKVGDLESKLNRLLELLGDKGPIREE